jgi:hypothetical protein
LGSSALLDTPLYQSGNTGTVLSSPIFLNENYIVLGVNKRTDADMAEFTKQRDTLIETALKDRRDQVFEDYLTTVKLEMQRDGKIKIYKDALDELQEEQPDIDIPARRPTPARG